MNQKFKQTEIKKILENGKLLKKFRYKNAKSVIALTQILEYFRCFQDTYFLLNPQHLIYNVKF